MLETQEKVGDVRRTPFGALKRICEENSMSRVLGSDMLARFESTIIYRRGYDYNTS